MTTDSSHKKAIIIGAGPAGLTAAYYLLKTTNIKPIILEKSNQIGGLSCTLSHNKNLVDIGGHRFFSKNKDIMNLWLELMPLQGSPAKDDKSRGSSLPLNPNGPDPEKENKVMLFRNRISRIFYKNTFFDYPISINLQSILNLGLLQTFFIGLSYIKSIFFKKKEKSLEDFYINRFGKKLYQMFFENYTEKLWGKHPSLIAADWGKQRIKSLSLMKALTAMLLKPFKNKNGKVETSLIDSFYYPKLGVGQFWETMAGEIKDMGGEIHLNNDVIRIKTEKETITSVISNENGEMQTYNCDYLLSSMPVKDLIHAMEETAPADIIKIATELPYRDFITVGLLVNKLKIKNKTKIKTINNIIPDCWIYIQETDIKMGRLQIFNNWSPYLVKDFENTVWLGLEYFCSEGDSMWEMPRNEFIDFAAKELEKIGIIDTDDVIDSIQIKVKKAYPAYFGSYSKFEAVRGYLDSYNNLYCIGRNGQHKYNNMDHSMLTAIEAVNSIKTGSDKSKIWQVNTEMEYNESK